jgi:hypothetical protein
MQAGTKRTIQQIMYIYLGRKYMYSENLSKLSLHGKNFYFWNKQVFGLYRVN